MTRPRVYVGMSGGVDSSVAAALLLDQDYDVTGVYMKNWSQDLPGMQCPWAEDLADAKRVAVQLGIDFKVFDFETQYRQKGPVGSAASAGTHTPERPATRRVPTP